MQERPVIVIETCKNCVAHLWNTRHKEEKYGQYFVWSKLYLTALVQESLNAEVPGVEVLRNEIPIEWRDQAPFKGRLGPQTGNRLTLLPNIGAFDVWHEGTLLFSKLQCRMWPNCWDLAKTVKGYLNAKASNSSDIAKYQVNYQHPGSKSPRMKRD